MKSATDLPLSHQSIMAVVPNSACEWIVSVINVVLLCTVYFLVENIWLGVRVDHHSFLINHHHLFSFTEIGPCIGPQWSVIGKWCCDWNASIAACGTILNSTVTTHLNHVFVVRVCLSPWPFYVRWVNYFLLFDSLAERLHRHVALLAYNHGFVGFMLRGCIGQSRRGTGIQVSLWNFKIGYVHYRTLLPFQCHSICYLFSVTVLLSKQWDEEEGWGSANHNTNHR